MDDRKIGFILSSFGLKVETDVGINAPVLASRDTLLRPLGLISDGPDGCTNLLAESSIPGIIPQTQPWWALGAQSARFPQHHFDYTALRRHVVTSA